MAELVSGPARFARFATPPNLLGFCGPCDDGTLVRQLTDDDEAELRALAVTFDGAYPYLELLAGAHRGRDPLDPEVVEAYWIGNSLLERVTTHDLGRSIDDRFRRRAGTRWSEIETAIAGGSPTHCFHVLRVMPWAGLIRDGIVEEPLHIVDRCRISWASALEDGAGAGASFLVRRRPLVWSGSRLHYGAPVDERVKSEIPVRTGDVLAIHWDWACERLDSTQLGWLRSTTDRQLATFHATR